MAHVDPRTGELVVRIVYDGAPRAGKTTNVRRLHETLLSQRAGALESPESTERRTEYFDFRDFFGGYVEGRALRCQLVSVPGQASLRHRRRFLLRTADAIVLVVDVAPEELEASRAVVRSLHAALGGVDVPLVLQANKLDRASDVDPGRLLDALRLPPATTTFGARARDGVGVADTFLAAVRLATTRVRARLREGTLEASPVPTTAGELYAALRALD